MADPSGRRILPQTVEDKPSKRPTDHPFLLPSAKLISNFIARRFSTVLVYRVAPISRATSHLVPCPGTGHVERFLSIRLIIFAYHFDIVRVVRVCVPMRPDMFTAPAPVEVETHSRFASMCVRPPITCPKNR